MSKENLHRKNPKGSGLSRRDFLGTTAAAAAGFTIIPRYVMGGVGYTAPSDMINVAGIGVGSQGGGDIQQICTPDVPIVRPQRNSNGTPMTKEQIAAQEARRAEMMKRNAGAGGPPGGAPNPNAAVQMGAAGSGRKIALANIYAICDVDPDYSGHIIKGYPKAKIYNDWREMLDKEKSIDAVVIGTPDHNHATIAAAFMRAKKHVYLEKPMAKTIVECRKLAELAKESDGDLGDKPLDAIRQAFVEGLLAIGGAARQANDRGHPLQGQATFDRQGQEGEDEVEHGNLARGAAQEAGPAGQGIEIERGKLEADLAEVLGEGSDQRRSGHGKRGFSY